MQIPLCFKFKLLNRVGCVLLTIDWLWLNVHLFCLFFFLAEALGTSVYSILSLAVCLAKNCTGWKVISKTRGELTLIWNVGQGGSQGFITITLCLGFYFSSVTCKRLLHALMRQNIWTLADEANHVDSHNSGSCQGLGYIRWTNN